MMSRRQESLRRYFDEVYVPMNFGPQGPIRRFCSRFFRTTASGITAHCIELLRSNPPKSVLDLGCGPGTFLADLAAAYPFERGIGVDVSAAALAMAEKRLPNRNIFTFERSPIEECAALRGSYDVVLAIGLFDYLPFEPRYWARLLQATENLAIVTLPRRRMRLQRLARRAWLGVNGVTLYAYTPDEIEEIHRATPEARDFTMYIEHPPDLPDNEWLVARRRV